MQEFQNIVGPVIRELREKKRLTQPQLVAKLNIAGWDLSRGTFSKIEAQIRCVTDYEILQLAAGLGIEPPELMRLVATRQKSENKQSPAVYCVSKGSLQTLGHRPIQDGKKPGKK